MAILFMMSKDEQQFLTHEVKENLWRDFWKAFFFYLQQKSQRRFLWINQYTIQVMRFFALNQSYFLSHSLLFLSSFIFSFPPSHSLCPFYVIPLSLSSNSPLLLMEQILAKRSFIQANRSASVPSPSEFCASRMLRGIEPSLCGWHDWPLANLTGVHRLQSMPEMLFFLFQNIFTHHEYYNRNTGKRRNSSNWMHLYFLINLSPHPFRKNKIAEGISIIQYQIKISLLVFIRFCIHKFINKCNFS